MKSEFLNYISAKDIKNLLKNIMQPEIYEMARNKKIEYDYGTKGEDNASIVVKFSIEDEDEKLLPAVVNINENGATVQGLSEDEVFSASAVDVEYEILKLLSTKIDERFVDFYASKDERAINAHLQAHKESGFKWLYDNSFISAEDFYSVKFITPDLYEDFIKAIMQAVSERNKNLVMLAMKNKYADFVAAKQVSASVWG